MADDPEPKAEESKQPERREPEGALFVFLFVLILLPCLAPPWVGFALWGWWAALIGIFVSHLIYVALFRPQGICMGMPFMFVLCNDFVIVVALATYGLLALFGG